MRQFSQKYRAIPQQIETDNLLKVFVEQYQNLKEFNKRTNLSNLEIDKNESKTVQTFKNILKSNVEKYLKIHFIHKFALVFDPKRKYI